MTTDKAQHVRTRYIVHDAGTIRLHYINATKSPAIYSSDLRELFLNLEDLEGERERVSQRDEAYLLLRHSQPFYGALKRANISSIVT